MWGISLGGMATMFWMPLEPRIKCGVVTAWFNQRRNKMVIPDPRYSCFLETPEEHAFFRGWLIEFTDSDVVSLICPRPLLVQTGKNDGRANPEPKYQEAAEAFQRAAELYPTAVAPHLYLGMAWYGQYVPGAESPENEELARKAEIEFTQALRMEPKNVAVLEALATL